MSSWPWAACCSSFGPTGRRGRLKLRNPDGCNAQRPRSGRCALPPSDKIARVRTMSSAWPPGSPRIPASAAG
eukprot:7951802-Pyramimonas_sp.AAC.1